MPRESYPEAQRWIDLAPVVIRDGTQRGNVISLVACAGEVGSGTTEAAEGRFFSKAVPLGGNTLKCPEECLRQPTALFGVFEELLALKYIVFVVARLLLF